MNEPSLEYNTVQKPLSASVNRVMNLTDKEKHLIHCLRANPNTLVMVKVGAIGQPESAIAIDAMLHVL